ncbi:hypothetical protein [Methylobacterium sp. CM6247]
MSDTSGVNFFLGEDGTDLIIFADTASGEADGGAGNDALLDTSSGSVTLYGGSGDDSFSYDGVGLTVIDDSAGALDLLLFSNVTDLGTLDFLRNGNDLIFAAPDDADLSHAVVVNEWFSSADSVDYIANKDSTQILNLYDLFG